MSNAQSARAINDRGNEDGPRAAIGCTGRIPQIDSQHRANSVANERRIALAAVYLLRLLVCLRFLLSRCGQAAFDTRHGRIVSSRWEIKRGRVGPLRARSKSQNRHTRLPHLFPEAIRAFVFRRPVAVLGPGAAAFQWARFY
ncbi:uncharacterized protein VTP21DRAFT_5868 [Calcarisporiella thermophila]|uniref:uncharacterized protein n=1 Tax=Calcarisporiella thermophila TaxID=911321 RepID=UPI0037445E00